MSHEEVKKGGMTIASGTALTFGLLIAALFVGLLNFTQAFGSESEGHHHAEGELAAAPAYPTDAQVTADSVAAENAGAPVAAASDATAAAPADNAATPAATDSTATKEAAAAPAE